MYFTLIALYWTALVVLLANGLPHQKSVNSQDFATVLETLAKDIKSSQEITINTVQSIRNSSLKFNSTDRDDDSVWVDIHKHVRLRLGSNDLHNIESQINFLSKENVSRKIEINTPDNVLVKYIVLGDMGSTGSRMYLFKVLVHPDKTIYVEPMPFHSKKQVPGIAKLASSPELLPEYVSGLVESIEEWFEKDPTLDASKCTLFFKATAGMRVVEEQLALSLIHRIDRLMTNETHTLRRANRFEYIPGQSFQVISGAMEGIFGWVTMNWYRNTLQFAGRGGRSRATFGPSYPITTAVLDLGGASSQITFEYNSAIQAKSNYIPVNINHTSTELYTHSYLQFGYNEAIRRYNDAFAIAAVSLLGDRLKSWHKKRLRLTAYDPCFWTGASEDLYYYYDIPTDNTLGLQLERIFNSTTAFDMGRRVIKVSRRGRWNQTMCSRFIKDSLLHLDTFCPTEPCAMAGVYQPPVPPQLPIAAIGTFADVCMFFHHECSGEFPVESLLDIANNYCGKYNYNEGYKVLVQGRRLEEAFLDFNTACLKLQYMHALLTDGFGLSNDRLVIFKERYTGVNIGWALGAAIYEAERFAQQITFGKRESRNRTSLKSILPYSTIY